MHFYEVIVEKKEGHREVQVFFHKIPMETRNDISSEVPDPCSRGRHPFSDPDPGSS